MSFQGLYKKFHGLGLIVPVFVTMFMFPKTGLSQSTPSHGLWPQIRVNSAQDNYPHPQVEFVDFLGCSPEQRTMIMQDRIDAQALALSSLEVVNSTLAAESPDPASYVKAGGTFTIDWTTSAARENWGRLSWDPDAEADRIRILNTLWKATGTYPNVSSNFPSNMGRVSIVCPGGKQSLPFDESCNKAIAFEYQVDDPVLNFCPVYFDFFSHDELHSVLEKYPHLHSSVKVFDLSRMYVILHESLHIDKGPAKQCDNPLRPDQGCRDYAYGSGRSKKLALISPLKASTNNDNYGSFAAARYMEKRYGRYPKYPSRWSFEYDDNENFRRAQHEPGFISEATIGDIRSDLGYSSYRSTQHQS